MDEKMFLEILKPSLILFVLTSVLTIVSSAVLKNDDKALASSPSIWEGFVSAPPYVRAVVIWMLFAALYSVYECILMGRQITMAAISITIVFLLARLLMSCYILKGHKWPRTIFQIFGTLGVVGGILERMTNASHVWTALSVNLVINGVVGLVMYALLAMKESVKWRDEVRAARVRMQQ